ncbi:MAG: TolC family protein [Psychroflexus sp.]|nr:TolC family protein [Psychroflexus sp.]MDN6309397.1 TolC family protein [Psychroflexus sp.]
MAFQRKYKILGLLLMLICVQLNAQEIYSLKKALQTAKANNTRLKSEKFDINIAESDILTAKLRPNLSFSNESLQLINSSEFTSNTSWYNGENRETFWELSKPIQLAGQRKNKIEIANKNVEFTEKNYAEVERHLFLDVAEKWLQVWAAQKQLDIIDIAKDNVDSLVKTNQRRYESQVITQTELFRTELLAKQYATQFKTAKQEVNSNQRELGYLLGSPKEVEIDTTAHFLFKIPDQVNDLVDKALEKRSDIQSTKSLIEVSKSQIDLEKSLAYPTPEIGVIYNPQGTVPFLGISFSIDLPVFDRNQGEIQKSRHRQEQAEQQLKSLKKELYTEVTVAHENYKVQQQNKEDFKELLEQSQTILNNVKHAYLKGGTSIIDFLEAQRSWLETQQQYYDVLESYRQSYISILYASGLINQLAL